MGCDKIFLINGERENLNLNLWWPGNLKRRKEKVAQVMDFERVILKDSMEPRNKSLLLPQNRRLDICAV
jgi:hypothetical protein